MLPCRRWRAQFWISVVPWTCRLTSRLSQCPSSLLNVSRSVWWNGASLSWRNSWLKCQLCCPIPCSSSGLPRSRRRRRVELEAARWQLLSLLAVTPPLRTAEQLSRIQDCNGVIRRTRRKKKRKKTKLPRAPRPRCGRPCARQRQVPAVRPSDSVHRRFLDIPVVQQRQVPTVHTLLVQFFVTVVVPVVVQRQVRNSMLQKTVVWFSSGPRCSASWSVWTRRLGLLVFYDAPRAVFPSLSSGPRRPSSWPAWTTRQLESYRCSSWTRFSTCPLLCCVWCIGPDSAVLAVPQLQFITVVVTPCCFAEADPHGPGCSDDHLHSTVAAH